MAKTKLVNGIFNRQNMKIEVHYKIFNFQNEKYFSPLKEKYIGVKVQKSLRSR